MRAVRLHQLLMVAAILVPAALFGGAALENRRDVLREGRETVQRTTLILHEHARKVFETEQLVLARVADRITNMTDAQIATPETSAFLTELKAPLEQAVSIWISAADGTVLAGSQPWPPGTGIAGRDFFEVQRHGDVGIYVSGDFEGKATQTASFAVSRRRPSPNGSFRGTIHIALSPDYFRRFYAEATPPYPSLAALVRADGEVLVHQPARPGYHRLSPDSPLRRAIAANPEGGIYDSESTSFGTRFVNAYRKVAAYPVYVRFGVERRALLSRWHQNLMIYGVSAVGASAVLLMVSWLALSRARAEEAALTRLRGETEQRLLAEERLRHAQRLEALGQLAGGIAHDFNNVLQAMSGGAALIQARADDQKMVRRLAQMIQDAGRRGASVTGRLLAFARRSDLRAEPVDVTTLFNGMRDILAHTLGAGIEVTVDVGDELPPLLADLGQLETVLVNLATNARDAMRDGGTLTMAADTIEVTRRPEHGMQLDPGNYVRLFIIDTGSGMDAATLARASDPFFTTKPRGQGTGLGLAMARGFAEQSGGGLHIESRVGHGTTVALWLPAATGAKADPPIAEAGPAVLGTDQQRPRVLLVDDEPLVRQILAQQLDDAGYEVLPLPGGPEALAALRHETADVLVTDLSMPGVDGIALIRQAREHIPGLPAILLTGYAGDGATLAIGKAISGSFAVLRKPVQRTQLLDQIAMLLPGGHG